MLVENLPVPFDRRVWMESRALAEAGYQVSVICPAGTYSKRYECVDGIHIYRYWLPSLPGFIGHLLEYGIALPATLVLSLLVLVRHGFDVIHSANPPDLFFLIAALYRPFGKKYVFDHHDLVPEACLTRWTGWKRRLMYRLSIWFERATFACADMVISTNKSYRTIAIGRGRMPPDRVVVVRSGPSLQRFTPGPPDPALRRGADYLATYLGVMGPNDGLDLLLEVIRIVVHEHGRNDIRFALIGSGDCHERTVARARELRITEYVHFTGRIPDADVIKYLSTADVGFAPDPKDDLNDVSTMNKIVEYMALGVPVLCFDLIEARASAGDSAAYASASDPRDMAGLLLALLADPERRRRMAALGRERFVASLAWEHQEPKLIAAYRQVLGVPDAFATGR